MSYLVIPTAERVGSELDSQSGIQFCIVNLNAENGKKMAGVFDIELSTAGVPINALIASMCRSAQRVTLADKPILKKGAEGLFGRLQSPWFQSRVIKGSG
jgi:hypothetical protein